MAEYNGNDVFLTMNGVDVEARWRSFEMNLNVGDEDVSAGAGIEWEKHASKLKNIQGTITLIYNTTQAATDFAALWTENQEIAVVYGPENNTATKPKHDQDFLITSISGPTTGHDKPAVMVEFSVISRGVPRSNIYAGDTF
ncbi:MAG: hypothetical protein K8L99_18180 [Anaerolineae bacterium]|nr:hypothetical protein [Anaerolineae bacterium]